MDVGRPVFGDDLPPGVQCGMETGVQCLNRGQAFSLYHYLCVSLKRRNLGLVGGSWRKKRWPSEKLYMKEFEYR